MEFLRDLPPWSILVPLVFISLLVLLTALRTYKRQVKWNPLIQLAILDLAALYVYFNLRNVPFDRMPRAASYWAIFFAIILIVLPLAVYWGLLRFASLSLLPFELKHLRQWSFLAKAIVTFVRGGNYPYYGYNEEADDLKRRLSGSFMRKKKAGTISMQTEHDGVLHTGPKLTRVGGGDIVFSPGMWNRYWSL